MKFLLAVLLPTLSWAAILPETIGPYHRTKTAPAALSDKPLWDEFGLKQSETTQYENGKLHLSITAYQLGDTTGSMAASDWLTPTDPSIVVHGNYLLSFAGTKLEPAELTELQGALKQVDVTGLPVLPTYLSATDLVPGTTRYLLGPVGLAKFYPGLAPSVVAFRYGAEAVVGTYRTGTSETTLAIFNYPTHPMAREREAEFSKVPGAMVKRSGPLLAVVLNAPNPDTAEKLLGQVKYQATVTRDEYVPTKRDNIGHLVLSAFRLIGILLLFALISGLGVAGLRQFRRRGGRGDSADALTTLDLNRR